MIDLRRLAKPLAYWIVVFGCTLALVTALAPLPTGSYKLSVGFLMLGVTPYVVYGSFTEVREGAPMASAGILLLVLDVLARFGANVTSAAHASVVPAIYLCAILVLVVLPAGVAVGKLFSGRRAQ
jgi:hypothetical protein